MITNKILKWCILCHIAVVFWGIPLLANDAQSLDYSLSAIRAFFVGKQKEISKEKIDCEFDPKCEAIKWLSNLQSNKQIELNNEQVWSLYIPSLWRALYMNHPDSFRIDKCDNEKLFIAFLSIFLLPELTEANAFVDGIICTGFERQLIDKYADLLIKPFLTGKFDIEDMYSYRIPKEFAAFFPKVFERQFSINRKKLKQIQNPSIFDKCRYLEFNAYFGDPIAANELITLFKSCSGDANIALEFDALLSNMFMIASKDSLIAVLSRFSEEIGAPDFDVSGEKRSSPRYEILCGFKGLYPDDPFFVKYKSYIRTRRGIGMDKDIGGEAGVKQLFIEFREWAKNKFGYEIDLSNVTYHINLKRLRYED